MLLNEILNIAKNLNNYKELNESFKSTKLVQLLQPFLNSTLTKKAYYLNSNNLKTYNNTYLDAEYAYRHIINNNNLTQDLCDDPKQRLKIINQTVKKYKNGQNKILYLIDVIKSKTEEYIGLSDIQDKNLISIDIEDAKKKPYKSGLQFWVNNDDELRAICINNKIIALIIKGSKFDSIIEVNPDYKGPTDISKLYDDTNTHMYLDEFLDKAFNIIPKYNILLEDKHIKKELGVNNIKTLQNARYKYDISKVYVVNEEGMQNINTEEKLKTRKDYKDFLKQQIEFYQKDYKTHFPLRYVNKLELARSKNVDNKILQKLPDLFNIVFETFNALNNKELTLINNNDKILYKNLYDDINIDDYILPDIQNELKNTSLAHKLSTYKYSRRENRVIYNIYNISDLFIILNVILKITIDKIIELEKNLNEIQNNQDKNDINTINLIKHTYKNFNSNIKLYFNHIDNLIKIANRNNVDLINIFRNLLNFKFDL